MSCLSLGPCLVAVQGNQVGFIKGRLLFENVLLATELVKNFQMEGDVTRGCLHIDLSKAYDNVNWEFLFNILSALNLSPAFIGWIKICVSTPSYSIFFNGELIGFFQGKKGIRQGDQMSSHLFVLVMDIIAKSPDKVAINGRFDLHPQCSAPLITHLRFADDVLVFFNGSLNSIDGILNILEEFKQGSGLGINRSKTTLVLDGGDFSRSSSISATFGIKQGSLPVRYLGVPLMAQKMKKHDYQPLLDRIKYKFSTWTARHLSFAGRLQLLKSVIYSTINFWVSIFMLPNQCLLKLEQMCNAFLWKGAPNSTRGANIAWDILCTQKECGGLGLRRLNDLNKVLALKHIWLLFTAAGSLWVSWVRINLIGHKCFWDLNPSYSGSWIWRKLCKLRPLARPFLICDIGSGETASFWQDNWTGLGPLIDITGPVGPISVGMPLNAVVRDALRGDVWWLSSSRIRNPTIVLLKSCVPDVRSIPGCTKDDVYLWKADAHAPTRSFSAAKMWLALHPPGAQVQWHKSIWFKDRVPKNAFIAWVAAWNRLHTRDRLRSWGFSVPALCVLCNVGNESRDHLFFRCPFSEAVKSASSSRNLSLIIKLICHASIFLLWRERNARIHTSNARCDTQIIKEIQLLIQSRLDPLSRKTNPNNLGNSLLVTWFALFQD
ncbi:putative RNA-directed DNA polymerase [Arabidopsis thaliana]